MNSQKEDIGGKKKNVPKQFGYKRGHLFVNRKIQSGLIAGFIDLINDNCNLYF